MKLSVRQHEVLALIAEGLSNKEIGRQLGISDRTVVQHAGEIRRRLGVKSRTASVVAYVKGL